jgi:protease-4
MDTPANAAGSPQPSPSAGPAAPSPVATASPQRAAPRHRSVFGLLVMLVFFLGLGGSLLLNLFLLAGRLGTDSDAAVQEKYFSHERSARHKVAIIPISGMILEGGDGFVKHAIDRVSKDETVSAIVLRVDSPGGSVSGSNFLYHHLKNLTAKSKIPMVVSMGSLAASGGYYVSMAAGPTPDSIYAEPTTWTGSIGVIIPHYNLAGLLKEYGVKEDSVASHRLKNMGSLAREMTDEERKIFQDLVDESFAQFKQIIRENRPRFQSDPTALDKLATGQVYTAQQARKLGLIDSIGFLEDAVDRAIKLAKLDPKDVTVVKLRPETGLLDLLLGQARGSGFELNQLLDAASPQAYYLANHLPPLVKGRP